MAVVGLLFLVVLCHVHGTVQLENCTLGLMADRVLRKAYEAMDVGLWIALSASSS